MNPKKIPAKPAPAPARHHGLGRGLDALIQDGGKPAASPAAPRPAPSPAPADPDSPASPAGVARIPLSAIEPNPFQPRREFDPAALQELADSIREKGLLQPVLLRPVASGRYQLIAGERRFRAARLAALPTLPAIVQNASDVEMRELALVENIQRSDLNIVEEAEAYRDLAVQSGLTQDQIAQRVGKSRAAVANSMRLLDLSPAIRQALASGQLSAGHAKVLLSAPPADRDILASRVIAQSLSVRALEKLVKSLAAVRANPKKTPNPSPAPSPKPDRHLLSLAERIQQELGTKVSLTPPHALANGKREMGRIVIEYFDSEDLSRLLETLNLSDLA